MLGASWHGCTGAEAAGRRRAPRPAQELELQPQPTCIKGGKAGAIAALGAQIHSLLAPVVGNQQLAAMHCMAAGAAAGVRSRGHIAVDQVIASGAAALQHLASSWPAMQRQRRRTSYTDGSMMVRVPNMPSAFSLLRWGCKDGRGGQSRVCAATGATPNKSQVGACYGLDRKSRLSSRTLP
jgi:hypothetical protein